MVENFVRRMKEYHDLQVLYQEQSMLFNIDDKMLDEFYLNFDNERLIKTFNF